MKKINLLVQSLLDKYHFNDPFKICNELDINCFFVKIPLKTNGVYYKVLNQQVILINKDLPEKKAKVTAAHELGHALLHPDMNYMFMTKKRGSETNSFEYQADYFAACLLLSEICQQPDFSEMSCENISFVTGLNVQSVDFWRNQQL